MHDNRIGVAALCRDAVLANAVVRIDFFVFTKLFESVFAIVAHAARIDKTSGPGQVAYAEFGHVVSNGHYGPDDFVPGNHRKNGAAPFVADLVQIGMANATIFYIEPNVMRTQFASFEKPRGKIGLGILCRIAFSWYHGCIFA
jgi:hypothetical protein